MASWRSLGFMRASQIRKKYLTPQEINIVIGSSEFVSFSPFLEVVLNESRRANISASEFLELQGKIAGQIMVCERRINFLGKKSDRVCHNNEWKIREIYKAYRMILKKIMDGAAFRFLNFERPELRKLSDHNQTGHLSAGFLEEVKKAAYIVSKTGFHVILNDLTNFLRYGDLTIISQEKILIDEVKTSGAAKGNQKKNLDDTIQMLNQKKIKIGDQVAERIVIPGSPNNFLNQVGQLIEKSKQVAGGVFAERVSPYLWVSSIYTPKSIEFIEKNEQLPSFPIAPFPEEDWYSWTNSLMFFDEFSPNMMPYSVFPFSEKVVCEILTGQVQLKSIISRKELVKTFKGKGWNLSFPSRQAIAAVYDTDDINIIKRATHDPNLHCTLSNGKFGYKIPSEVLLRIDCEFLSAKSIVSECEALMSMDKNVEPRLITSSFSGEHLIWK